MPAGDSGFVSLAEVVRSAAEVRAAAPSYPAAAGALLDALCSTAAPDVTCAPDAPAPLLEAPLVESTPRLPSPEAVLAADASAVAGELRTAIREARLFRAALADALDVRIDRLVRGVAERVVGRELQCGAADVAAIAHRLIEEMQAEEPVRLRVAPADAGVRCDLPVIVDPSLERGDAVLDCRDGSIDARLPVRLALVVTEVTA